jgi:hypothetical protein
MESQLAWLSLFSHPLCFLDCELRILCILFLVTQRQYFHSILAITSISKDFNTVLRTERTNKIEKLIRKVETSKEYKTSVNIWRTKMFCRCTEGIELIKKNVMGDW